MTNCCCGAPAPDTVRLPVNRILLHGDVPSGCNLMVIASLAYMYRSTTEDAPPIRVRTEGPDLYTIVDGRHRVIATIVSGRNDILAEVET